MIIKKILNNNVVITLNDDGEEIIVMGKGLAYGKKTGEDIDIHKVNKVFELCLKGSQKKMINLLKDIPLEYIEISDQVIQKARKELTSKIDDSLYVSLTDHIHTSIERYKIGLPLKNQILFEIKHFYQKEFELGLWTLDLIEKKYHILMDEDEAGFIAMHIVSSEIGENIGHVYEVTSFIQSVLSIVTNYFHISFDESSLSYYRFVTHLKFFGLRVFNHVSKSKDEMLHNDLLELMKEKYVEPYKCALKIQTFIERDYLYDLDDEEILFLTIHIAKIISHK